MTDAQAAELKAKLEAEIKTLKKRLPAMKDEAKPVEPDTAVGRLSRMNAIDEKGVRDKAVRDAEERLQNLQARLAQAGTVDFGRCAGCRREIPFARLIYMPESGLCVGCAR